MSKCRVRKHSKKYGIGDDKMVKKLKLLLIFVAATALVACGSGDSPNQAVENDQDGELLPLEVEILTESDAFEPGVAGEIQAKVWQGNENIDDADEVVFEIWKEGHEDESENFDGESVGEGIYSLTHTFEEDGLYYVIAHVTARDMHTMPKKEFIVGNVETLEHEHGDDDHSDQGNGVSIHLVEPDTVVAGENAAWIVHLEQDGSPLTEAEVQLEYWKGEDKHEYIDAMEGVDGEYTAELNFAESGEYEMTVHVVKGDLHEHKEIVIDVQ